MAWALTAEQEEEVREEATNFKYQTVKTQEGLNYRIPEDMPIESRNGIQAPIPFDEYMYSKFKAIDNKLQNMDEKLDHLEALVLELKENKPKVLTR